MKMQLFPQSIPRSVYVLLIAVFLANIFATYIMVTYFL
jgi:hypothetical protein